MSFRFTFNPGDFGATLGHIDGAIDATALERVKRDISEGFLKYQQSRAFKQFDLDARASGPSETHYHHAYAGAHPGNIGQRGKRLFKIGEVRRSGHGYSIEPEFLKDTEPAWSPVLQENTEYIYRDRMEENVGQRIEKRIFAPTSLGKQMYAVAREGQEIIYAGSFMKRMGGDAWAKAMSSALQKQEEKAVGELNRGTKSSITRVVNKTVRTSGSTGAAKSIMQGYSSNRKRSKKMFADFMSREMYKLIRRSQT